MRKSDKTDLWARPDGLSLNDLVKFSQLIRERLVSKLRLATTEEVIQAVEIATGFLLKEMKTKVRAKQITTAQHILGYSLIEFANLSHEEAGQVYGRGYQAAEHSHNVVEATTLNPNHPDRDMITLIQRVIEILALNSSLSKKVRKWN